VFIKNPLSNRPIRSFVIRSGRLTNSQRKAIQTHWESYVLNSRTLSRPDCFSFPKNVALSVEIGFGMGDTLLQMATDEPTKNFVGIEVHRPGIGKLLHHIAENDLKNLWIICQDAKEAMMNCFESNSIDKIFILFPDPWPKKRHQKRRLIQSNFVALLTEKLKPGGILHLATDWKPYAEQMLEILEQSKGLVNENGSSNYWECPKRPETKFERRGKRLGYDVWDLLFSKSAS